MMRALFIFLLLLLSVGLGVQLHRDPGYLLIAINHWTIETTLWIALLGLILLFLVLHMLLVLLKWVVRIPSAWHNQCTQRRLERAQAKTKKGLIEFSEGHWLKAKKYLISALPNTDTPLLNYLTAARAAQEMGDSKLRDNYLREAQQSMPEARIAVELTQAQLQLSEKQWEQALATLKHLQDLAPNHPYVLKLLTHLYQEVRDWRQLMELLPQLKQNQVLSSVDFNTLQQQVYLQTLLEMIHENQIEVLTEFMASLPKSLRHDVGLIAAYCRYQIHTHNYSKAESLLRECLRKQFHEELIALYGQLKDDKAQLGFAESMLKEHSQSAALLLCLGRLSFTNHLWGKAKAYFEASIECAATSEAYAALGQLFEQLEEPANACAAYRQGLLLALQ